MAVKNITFEDKVPNEDSKKIRKNQIWAEDINEIKTAINDNATELSNRVKKEDGKVLSTNDFTNELKEKVENAGSGSIEGVTVSRELTAADSGKVLVVKNSGLVLTIPAEGLPDGFVINIFVKTGFSCSINVNGNLYEAPSGLSIESGETANILVFEGELIITI